MTALADKAAAAPVRTPAQTPAVQPAPPAGPLDSRTLGPGIASVMGLAALLFFGFLAYLIAFSGLSQARAQHALREQMFTRLSLATAPTGPRRTRLAGRDPGHPGDRHPQPRGRRGDVQPDLDGGPGTPAGDRPARPGRDQHSDR